MRAFILSFFLIPALTWDVYAQCVSGNCDNGQGSYQYSDGRYVGRWKNGLRHGEGTFVDDNGTKYICQWVDDEPNGKGKIIYHDGSSFSGVIKKWNPYDGYGTVIGGNYRFTGYLKKGVWQGKGKIIYIEKGENSLSGHADGDMYEGNFVDGQIHGQGTFYYANGDIYRGSWKKNQKHGKGTMKFEERGFEYTGDWKDNRPHGRGVLSYTSGAKYTGDFKEGCFDGNGTLTFDDGSKYTGQWKECKKHGDGVLYKSDGTIAQKGKWEEDEFADNEPGNEEEAAE